MADREELRADLAALPWVQDVPPSGGNFLLATFAGPAAAGARLRCALLADEAIAVKDVSERFPEDVARLRVAVRTASENALLVDALVRVAPEALR